MTLIDKINGFTVKPESGMFNILLGSALSIVGFASAWPQDPGTSDKFLYDSWGYGGVALALYGLSSIADKMYKEKYSKSIWDIDIKFKRNKSG